MPSPRLPSSAPVRLEQAQATFSRQAFTVRYSSTSADEASNERETADRKANKRPSGEAGTRCGAGHSGARGQTKTGRGACRAAPPGGRTAASPACAAPADGVRVGEFQRTPRDEVCAPEGPGRRAKHMISKASRTGQVVLNQQASLEAPDSQT